MVVKEVGFMSIRWFGVYAWIWFYFIFSISAGIFVIIYFFKERIKKKYYEIRFPEKLIKVVMHYPSSYFKEYWRLIPDDNFIIAEGKRYQFSKEHLEKSKDLFVAKNEKKESQIFINKETYTLKDLHLIHKRWRKYPEIHYFYNAPTPIKFDTKNEKIDITSTQLDKFNENDLFSKLLTMEDEKRLVMLVMIMVIINLLATAVLIAIQMEWIKIGK